MKALETIKRQTGKLDSGLTDLDALVLSYLSGVDGIEALFESSHATLGEILDLYSLELDSRDEEFLEAIRENPRYRDLRIVDQFRIQSDAEDKYSTIVRANLYLLKDNTLVLAFSGTPGDIDSIIESLKMHYLPEDVKAFGVAEKIIEDTLEKHPAYQVELVGITRGATLVLGALGNILDKEFPNLGDIKLYEPISFEGSDEIIVRLGENSVIPTGTSVIKDYLEAGKDQSLFSLLFSEKRDELNWEFNEDGSI